MTAEAELELLRLFERTMERPEPEREAWLSAQDLSPQTRARLQRLLERENSLGDFLEQPPTSGAVEIPRLPETGERVGPYQLMRLIEAGGMGVVYLARRADEVYEQQVAIKLVQPLHLASSGELRRLLIARFDEERSILAQLRHPNIARILDGGSTESGIPYLVMEYVDGVPLTQYCRDHALDVRQRLRVFCKVCDGVQDAHRHLIVHRDLKPANILVAADGEPRLLDFGIAKLLDPARAGIEGREHTALAAMTPAYASPEQVRHQPITTRSDVYSLGVMLYQLLTDRRPYDLDALSPAEAERMVCEHEPEAPSRVLHDRESSPAQRRQRKNEIGTDLDKIVAKAMHKQAERRYGSAQELADDLRRYLDGHPVAAHADTRTYRIGKFLRRHRLASAGVAFALTAILAAAGVALEQARQARQAAADAAEINQFLIDILARSDPGNTGEEVTLGQALDAAAEQVDQRFGDRAALSAGIRYAIGYSMLSRHRLDQAELQIERGLREAESAFGENDARTLELLEAKALLRQYQGRNSEAIELFQTVIARLRDSGQTRSTLYAVSHNDLGVLYLDIPDYLRAREHIQQALGAIEQDGVQVTIHEHANIVSNLAHVMHGLEELGHADALYAHSAELLSTIFPDGSRDIAILLNNRALLARDMADNDRALDLLAESVAMRKQVFQGDHPMIVLGLTNLARQAITVERMALALDSASEAVAMSERLFDHGGSERAVALAVFAQASLHAGTPDQAADALRRAEQVLSEVPEATDRIRRFVAEVRQELCQAIATNMTDC